MTAAPAGETPLAARLKAAIRREGPMRVSDYMAACLDDPAHGYYRTRPAIGAAADFTTAPEISQVFGELIGLWCAVVWQQMGAPAALNLVELGPGRGTLMRDALRASRIVPGFQAALSVHLVDSNATLREAQRAMLAEAGPPIRFHDDVSALGSAHALPAAPTIVIANEFLDTLPVAQLVYTRGAWHDRTVGLDGAGELAFSIGETVAEARPVPAALAPQEGDILEIAAGHNTLAGDILRARAGLGPLAALFIDYGHAATGFGETLQGVARQAHVSPLAAPGETDLSAQVDFQHFAEACRRAGLAVDGPVPQGEFLGRLGIVERTSRLMAANPAKALAIEGQVQRLMAPTGMGSRFLAIGVRSAELAPLPGLA